jgi:hypothetical protein
MNHLRNMAEQRGWNSSGSIRTIESECKPMQCNIELQLPRLLDTSMKTESFLDWCLSEYSLLNI